MDILKQCENGVLFMYNSEHWRPSAWNADIKTIKQIGVY
jgi:hypothetical protein